MSQIREADLTVARLAALIRKRKISPVALTKEMLEKIELLQPRLNAFITVTADLAMKQAREAEQEICNGSYRGPLHGIPLSLKDIFYTRGIRTTAGSKILRNFVPKENAVVVDRLFAAGSILLGKTNLHEFAYGATNVNPHYGPVRNPWNLDRISGGSSGGSAAAVSAGLGLASLGTDTGGSIRIPAAACGVVGLKPTRGRVPLDGVVPLAFSLDHVGPLCRCVEDAALLLGVIVGEDARDPEGKSGQPFSRTLRQGLRGLRVGVPKQYFFDRLQKDVRQRVVAAIATLEGNGAQIQEVSLKYMGETSKLATEITVTEALAFHWKWLQKRPQDYGTDLRSCMEGGARQLAVVYLHVQERRRIYGEAFARSLESVDVLAAPTLPVVAPRIDETEVSVGRTREDVRLALLRLNRPSNLTGFPAISVPCGFSSDNLPVGLQLIGRKFEEATLLRVAYAYEQSTPWHTMFPSTQALASTSQ